MLDTRPAATGSIDAGPGAPAASWYLLIDEARSGAENMARDQALLDLAETQGLAALRLYQWTPHCISFGRNEPALVRYDRGQITAQGFDVVRRPTGGRAVWHARELTYAVVAPVSLFGSLPEAYRTIHLMLASAIESLGASPQLAPAPPRHPRLDAGACFASPAGGEVTVADRKVIGSAQLRQGSAFLQHGSILVDDGQEVISRVTRGAPPASLGTPLSALVQREIAIEEIIQAVADSASRWSGGWSRWAGEDALGDRARTHLPRFRSPDWTWHR